MTYKLRRENRAEVLEALRKGEYEAIATSGQSAVDALVHLAIEIGVFEALEVIEVRREREGIPDDLLLRTLSVLPFVEAIGLSASAGRLFEDAAILLQVGFSIEQVRNGFNQRHHGEGKAKTSKPCHPEVLRQELARIDLESLATFRQAVIKQLFERDLVKGKTYALDGTGLKDRHRLVGVLNIHKDRALWLNWRLLDSDASEKGKGAHIVRDMIEEILDAGGEDVIDWLLMDALYADGPLLAWLEYGCGIHALVRLPEDRDLYVDLQGLARGDLLNWEDHTDVRYVAGRKQVRRVSVAMDSDLTSWDSFLEAAASYGVENPTLWGALIHAVDAEDPTEEEDWGLVSTCSFSSGWAGYRKWRQRWRIENTGFRELKEGWHLEGAPWSYTEDTVVAARLAFTLVAFNVAQIAKTAQGRRLTDRGIRRLRRELAPEYGPAPVIVFTEDAFGVFHIEEVMEALGFPPAASLRRHRGGLHARDQPLS
ncbi:MAG: transposase [Chloroflexota bacterium]|nr:transposase [Chloroflexota bacterium]